MAETSTEKGMISTAGTTKLLTLCCRFRTISNYQLQQEKGSPRLPNPRLRSKGKRLKRQWIMEKEQEYFLSLIPYIICIFFHLCCTSIKEIFRRLPSAIREDVFRLGVGMSLLGNSPRFQTP